MKALAIVLFAVGAVPFLLAALLFAFKDIQFGAYVIAYSPHTIFDCLMGIGMTLILFGCLAAAIAGKP